MRKNDRRATDKHGRVDTQPFIDCVPQAAYWLGYLYANASIVNPTSGSSWFAIVCASNEENHLKRMAEYTGVRPTVFYTRGGKYANLRIRDTKFVHYCASVGIVKEKKLRGAVDENLATRTNFWRGLFDANAWIVNNSELRVVMSIPLAEQFMGTFAEVKGFPEYLSVSMPTPTEASMTDRHGGEVSDLLRFLYAGVPITDVSPALQEHVSRLFSAVPSNMQPIR